MLMSRRPLVALVASLCLVTAACGSDERPERADTVSPQDEGAGQTAGGGEAAPEVDGDVTLDEEQLTAALLSVSDLPTGYSVSTEQDDNEDTTTTGADEECSAKFEQLSEAEDMEAASAEISFEEGIGVILEQSLESYEDGGELEQRFEAVTEVLSECPTFTDTDADGVTTEFQVVPLSFPNLGDRTLALAITGSTPDFTLRLNLAIVQLGNHAMFVGQGGLAADAAVLEQAGRAGVAKLAAAIDAA